jgi:hypothetical protein
MIEVSESCGDEIGPTIRLRSNCSRADERLQATFCPLNGLRIVRLSRRDPTFVKVDIIVSSISRLRLRLKWRPKVLVLAGGQGRWKSHRAKKPFRRALTT